MGDPNCIFAKNCWRYLCPGIKLQGAAPQDVPEIKRELAVCLSALSRDGARNLIEGGKLGLGGWRNWGLHLFLSDF